MGIGRRQDQRINLRSIPLEGLPLHALQSLAEKERLANLQAISVIIGRRLPGGQRDDQALFDQPQLHCPRVFARFLRLCFPLIAPFFWKGVPITSSGMHLGDRLLPHPCPSAYRQRPHRGRRFACLQDVLDRRPATRDLRVHAFRWRIRRSSQNRRQPLQRA